MRRNETGYKKHLKDEEYKQIKKFLDAKESPSLKMCVRVMSILGLRVGDAVALKREYFSNDFSTLIFKPNKTEKYNKILERKLPPFLEKELKDYYKKYHHKTIEGYLFFASWRNQSKNKHLQRSTVGLLFRDMRRKLKLDQVYHICKDGKKLHRISPHTMRHYAAWRYYVASDSDIVAVQTMLGHSDISMTQKYIYPFQEANREIDIVTKAFSV